MRIAHISPTYGGVGTAAARLHNGLVKIGVDSSLFTTHRFGPNSDLPQVYPMPPANRLLRYADILSKMIDNRFGLTGMTHVSSLFHSYPEFDVIHLHGADSNWFNMNALRRLGRNRVLVWTMHDKHLGTGACGYPEGWGDCERWRTGCGACPKVKANGKLIDFTRVVYQRKKAILSSSPLAIVSLNHWMRDFLISNPITRKQTLALIPNGVDVSVFTPVPTARCRAELKLPQDGKLLLYVASKLNEPRKGFAFCRELTRQLRDVYGDGGLSLVVVGSGISEDVLSELKAIIPVFMLGNISNIDVLTKVYNAADLFLITSIIDNMPSVVLESFACGTPVAGFSVGGIPEIVTNGKTGLLCELGDTAQLASLIRDLLDHPDRLAEMGINCRAQAVSDYSIEVQATRHIELYTRLMAERRQGVNRSPAMASAWGQ